MASISKPLRIALAQIDTTVGDIEGNVRKIEEYLARATDRGAQMVVFPIPASPQKSNAAGPLGIASMNSFVASASIARPMIAFAIGSPVARGY